MFLNGVSPWRISIDGSSIYYTQKPKIEIKEL
jgi:hypothetical protein